jgi:hypothetical protein
VCCVLGVGQFGEETEGGSSKWNCIVYDIMICVCWELDSLGRRLRGRGGESCRDSGSCCV